MSDDGHKGEIDYVRFFGSNYLEYDFSKITIPTSVVEHLRIVFTAESPDGLLWFGRNKGVTNYLELKKGVLVFHIMYMKAAKAVDRAYKIPPHVVTDGKKHSVEIKRSRNAVSKTSGSHLWKGVIAED